MKIIPVHLKPCIGYSFKNEYHHIIYTIVGDMEDGENCWLVESIEGKQIVTKTELEIALKNDSKNIHRFI